MQKSKKTDQPKCDGFGKITGIFIRKIDSEKKLERYLYKEVKKLGGIALKYPAGHHDGMLDRCNLLPYGLCYWLELKTTGKTPTDLQKLKIDELRALGYPADWIDNMIDLKKYVERLRSHQLEKALMRKRYIGDVLDVNWDGDTTKFI